MPLYLGIDASTQSVSAVVVDFPSGDIVAEASVSFGEDLPHYKAPQGFIPGGENGEVHSNPLMWIEALDMCLGRLRADGLDLSRITAISGAGQQHGTVYLNESGINTLSRLDGSIAPHIALAKGFSRPTSPIWMDSSTTRQCRDIEAACGGPLEVCRRSGSVAIERFSGPQIRRFFETDPVAYKATRRIHLVSSFIASVLAAKEAPIDHGDGAGMNLLNLETGDWDSDLLNATAEHLHEKLPPVAPSQTVIARVGQWLVTRHGFSPDATVIAFTGDNPSSLVGMGGGASGDVIISLGTSDTFFASLPDRRTDPNGFGHVFGHPLGGTMSLQCFLNGSLAREKVRDALGMDWGSFTSAIKNTPPGNNGNYLLPFFLPEVSPRLPGGEPIIIGSFGDDWQKDPSAARGCLEGQLLNIRLCSDWMGLAVDRILLTGGASANDAIAQVVADVFQAEVRRLEVSGSVALGGALRAALADKTLQEDGLSAALLPYWRGDPLLPNPQTALIYNNALQLIRERPV